MDSFDLDLEVAKLTAETELLKSDFADILKSSAFMSDSLCLSF